MVLEDAATCERIRSCPAANLNLRVVALEGDFCHDDSAMWSEEEFEAHVVKERDGKRPLLAGELKVSLKVDLKTLSNKIRKFIRCRLSRTRFMPRPISIYVIHVSHHIVICLHNP